jgi:hypothetical protein
LNGEMASPADHAATPAEASLISVVPSVLQGAAKEAYSAVIAPGKLEGIAERSWRKPALDSDCIAIRKSPLVLGR